jgi:hypothetical protein
MPPRCLLGGRARTSASPPLTTGGSAVDTRGANRAVEGPRARAAGTNRLGPSSAVGGDTDEPRFRLRAGFRRLCAACACVPTTRLSAGRRGRHGLDGRRFAVRAAPDPRAYAESRFYRAGRTHPARAVCPRFSGLRGSDLALQSHRECPNQPRCALQLRNSGLAVRQKVRQKIANARKSPW